MKRRRANKHFEPFVGEKTIQKLHSYGLGQPAIQERDTSDEMPLEQKLLPIQESAKLSRKD
jgi:hypothetical protein